jgi:hypothetical protein
MFVILRRPVKISYRLFGVPTSESAQQFLISIISFAFRHVQNNFTPPTRGEFAMKSAGAWRPL